MKNYYGILGLDVGIREVVVVVVVVVVVAAVAVAVAAVAAAAAKTTNCIMSGTVLPKERQLLVSNAVQDFLQPPR